MGVKVDAFRVREGRDPSRRERAALEREASADTRVRKTGNGVSDLTTRWRDEAAELGWTIADLTDVLTRTNPEPLHDITGQRRAGHRSALGVGVDVDPADVLRAICDLQPAVSEMAGHRWAAGLERACDQVVDQCVDLDPTGERLRRRASDGRPVWLEPIAADITSDTILAEEERVLAVAIDAQATDSVPSLTVDRDGLNVLQADAAAVVAGTDRLVIVVGPAGAGKTTTLQRALDDLEAWGLLVFGVAPTAKAARVLERETGMDADTVAKLLHEWTRTDRLPHDRYRLPSGGDADRR